MSKGKIIIDVWTPIKDFEGLYEISSSGKIKSTYREGTKGGILKTFSDGRYLKVHLYKNGKQYQFYLHRLVAEHFLEKVEGKSEINHKNGDKLDNRLLNLEWCNRSENIQHANNTGLVKRFKVAQLKDGVEINRFLNIRQASLQTGISYNSIYWCCNGIYKTAGGYTWKLI